MIHCEFCPKREVSSAHFLFLWWSRNLLIYCYIENDDIWKKNRFSIQGKKKNVNTFIQACFTCTVCVWEHYFVDSHQNTFLIFVEGKEVKLILSTSHWSKLATFHPGTNTVSYLIRYRYRTKGLHSGIILSVTDWLRKMDDILFSDIQFSS